MNTVRNRQPARCCLLSGLFFGLFFMSGVLLTSVDVAAQPESSDVMLLRAWIQQMKEAERGPFQRIRWFCNDGTILPPRPVDCDDYGGGEQHGEWNERTKLLRSQGFYIANILADLNVNTLNSNPQQAHQLKHILIEKYLVNTDDGWILRRARFYRGAFQAESEVMGANRVLHRLAGPRLWIRKGFLPLRLAVWLLPHGEEGTTVAEVRQMATDLANSDSEFVKLRNKIHGNPEASDALRVRQYASEIGDVDGAARYEYLAALIEDMYLAPDLTWRIRELVPEVSAVPALSRALQDGAAQLTSTYTAFDRYALTAQLMATLRRHFADVSRVTVRMRLLDLSTALEVQNYVASTALREHLTSASRGQRVSWLKAGADAVYGTGLISERQWQSLQASFKALAASNVRSGDYKAHMQMLALGPVWGSQALHFHFAAAMEKLAQLEPKAELFVQEHLRASPLLFYSQVVDTLMLDANRLAGIKTVLFTANVGAGIRSLNPGLARGVLRHGAAGQSFDKNGIYILPETTAELPPVAGIITLGEGNPLSHVQLLARNLGIPNVSIDGSLLPRLNDYLGQRVILAVSPAGSVRMIVDGLVDGPVDDLADEPANASGWDRLFEAPGLQQTALIHADLEKLDLRFKELVPLSELRAKDSGRTVGPKAAKLGELYYHYPKAVANGLAIPFGEFRTLLDQPLDETGESVFDWMVRYYAMIRTMADPSEQAAATESLRQRLETWILQSDPGNAFKTRLRFSMNKVFGPSGSYGVFVRSDTNVEDLPGFTGAGLNLTVPHVVGFEALLKAIPRVWASPFSKRAYAWRQAHMDQPQHVYPAILLMRSVAADKSGVMVTQDIDTGEPGWLSIAVNEGVGGAVEGQAAESLRVNVKTGDVRLLAQATATHRRSLNAGGGVTKIPVTGDDWVLRKHDIGQLRGLAKTLPKRFPALVGPDGQPVPADIEFGFENGALQLFQIRPFLESRKARGSLFLNALDAGSRQLSERTLSMHEIP